MTLIPIQSIKVSVQSRNTRFADMSFQALEEKMGLTNNPDRINLVVVSPALAFINHVMVVVVVFLSCFSCLSMQFWLPQLLIHKYWKVFEFPKLWMPSYIKSPPLSPPIDKPHCFDPRVPIILFPSKERAARLGQIRKRTSHFEQNVWLALQLQTLWKSLAFSGP